MKFITVLLLVSSFVVELSPVELARTQFPVIESVETADDLINKLKEDHSPEAEGYTAAMNFMKSRFVKNPFTKMKYFNKGKKILDTVILNNPSNIEIRYIRYLMQKQIPAFLGYKENLDEDFKVISSKIVESTLQSEFKIEMLNNMMNVDKLSDDEKETLTEIIKQL